MAKYIVVSGGVISGIGKGVTAASIATLLKQRGYSVWPIKCENNLNVDFGTINPIEHGDPFLCFDGLESDQDLGNYERFLGQEVGHDNFITMGQLYLSVIKKERRMYYDGEDVEPIPHVVNEIINRLEKIEKKHKPDIIVIELGGTVGEYENNNGLYYEAARKISEKKRVAHVHVTYVPVPKHLGEPKTKPAQFGLKALMNMGILPDFLVIRSERPVDEKRKYKFAHKFNFEVDHIISNENMDCIYNIPLHLYAQNLDKKLLKHLGLKIPRINLRGWRALVKKERLPKKAEVRIAIIGKYFATGGQGTLTDSYYALIEALNHSALNLGYKIEFEFVNSEKEEGNMKKVLKKSNGVIVPIGWGKRGVKGMLEAIKFAREKKVPYLGLCYGMQLACVEFAQNVAGLKHAQSEEINPKAKHKIIHSIPFDKKYQVIKGDGCSMRLGSYKCVLDKDSYTSEIYGKKTVVERHRHRFEFNNEYRGVLEKAGLKIVGTSPDDFFVEFMELPRAEHPFFIGTQGHPEYKSTPLNPHPLFLEFLRVAQKHSSSNIF